MKAARPLRVLALVYDGLVPPADAKEDDVRASEWKTEYDVVTTLRGLGHEVLPLGVGGDLTPVRRAIAEFQPQLAFNLIEAFDGVATFDHNVVAFLELMHVPYTGCNARGLLLARDKAIAKKLLSYHRVPVADFTVVARGRKVRRPKRLRFPLIVKSATLDASIGISQASVVESDAKLEERVRFVHDSVGTDALVETYVEGRELYVGVVGNERLKVLPVWELLFANMPEEQRRIATERLKWNASYQRQHGIASGEAKELPPGTAVRLAAICRRVYRTLMLNGYARIDLRLSESGEPIVLEANPNPELARDGDLAASALAAGIPYDELLQRLLALALRWEPKRFG